MDIAKNREAFWKEDVRDYFIENNPATGAFRKRFIAKIVEDNNIKSVLELGCNSGGNLMAIHKRMPDVDINGFDICERAISHAINVEKNPAKFTTGSLHDDLDQYDDDSFDLVFTSSVLFHIPSERIFDIISNQKRIAKRFIFNIERYGNNNSVYIERRGIPHQWTTNYVEIYKSLGLECQLTSMEKKFPGKKHGSATHIISSSLSDENMIY